MSEPFGNRVLTTGWNVGFAFDTDGHTNDLERIIFVLSVHGRLRGLLTNGSGSRVLDRVHAYMSVNGTVTGQVDATLGPGERVLLYPGFAEATSTG